MTVLLDSIRSRKPRLAFTGGVALLSVLSVMPSPGVAQSRVNANSLATRVEALELSVQTQEQDIQRLQEQLQAPVEVRVDAVATGAYKSDGTPLSAGAGYIVGDVRGDAPSFAAELRNFFVFDLTQVREAAGASIDESQEVRIEEAQLIASNPQGGFASTASDIETYNINRAGRSPSGTQSPTVFDFIGGTAGKDGFTDLADGPGYGSYVVSPRAGNTDSVTIRLTSAALHDLNERINAVTDDGPSPTRPESRLFAIGGNLSTLNDVPDLEHVFARTGDSPVSLVVKLRILPPQNM